MTTHKRLSGLAAADRYALQLRLLSDADLAKWFISVCEGQGSAQGVDETTLALFEAGGLVRNTDYGVILAPEGRQFARDLSLIPQASELELNPISYFDELQVDDIDDIDIQAVWSEYKKTKLESLRNLLMEYYAPIVKENSEKIHAKLPEEVDIDNIMSAGIFGLMDAIDAFDPSHKVKFETYCAPRIRGAILDAVRSMDWVPRLVRSKTNQVEQTRRSLQMELGRAPTDEEMCRKLGINQEEYAKIREGFGEISVTSSSRKWFQYETDQLKHEKEFLKGDLPNNLVRNLYGRDLMDLITMELSREERMIVILYYYEEMTMKEIATTLDMSESRVSRMHSSILARLMAKLQRRSPDRG